MSSYPTYEEWKPSSLSTLRRFLFSLFLSYL